jgi:hypothetical protein
MTLNDLLKITPKKVMDKYKIKIRDVAIKKVKEHALKENNKIEDITDDDWETMISDQENKISDQVKIATLSTLLVAAGIKLSFF